MNADEFNASFTVKKAFLTSLGFLTADEPTRADFFYARSSTHANVKITILTRLIEAGFFDAGGYKSSTGQSHAMTHPDGRTLCVSVPKSGKYQHVCVS